MDEVFWGEPETDRRFRRILLGWSLLFLAVGAVVPLVPLPAPVHNTPHKAPPRFARVLIEPTPTPVQPPPARPAPKPALKPRPKPKPEPKPVAKPRARPKPQPKPQPKPPPKPSSRESARAAAESAGLLALKGELSDLRNDVDTKDLDRRVHRARDEPSRAEDTDTDALLARGAARGSGGIDERHLDAAVDDTDLAARRRGAVHSRLDQQHTQRHTRVKPGRSLEEIKLVIDRNRGAIDRLYNRVLRGDPTLRGKLILQLTIAASGKVTDCRVVSSELDAPKLERKLALRVKMMNFGPKPGPTVVLNFPIDLLPS